MGDKKIELTRRKVLGSMGAIGAAGAVGGYGTFAAFSDTEQTAATFSTGEIDLKLDWGATHFNAAGEHIVNSPKADYTAKDRYGEVVVELTDIKPGDWGCFVISLHLQSNPAWICGRMTHKSNHDYGGSDAEVEHETELYGEYDGGEGNGELQDHLKVLPFQGGSLVCDPMEDDCANKPVYDWGAGDYVEFWDAAGVVFHPKFDTETDGGKHGPLMPGGGNIQHIGIAWKLPYDTGNEAQTDSLSMTFDVGAVQARNSGYGADNFDD